MSVNNALLVVVLAQAVQYGTPLLYAALGELLAERSGVLNLGVEGMMLFGAATGYWATQRVHGSDAAVLLFAVLAAGVGGAAMAAIHAFLTITMRASQIVSGLALTIFAGGLGLSAYFGNDVHLADSPPAHQFGAIDVFGLKDLWVFGPILFNQSALVYASWALTAGIAFYLARTRWGLNVRAVGEAPASADAMGINVKPLSLCPRSRRRLPRRRRGLVLQPFDHARLDGGRHPHRRGRVDRDRPRHLRVLARRALPRRRLSLRRARGAPVCAAGARGAGHARVPQCPAVRDDDRRASDRVDELR